jgi:putative transposase
MPGYGWVLRTQPKIKIDYKRRRLLIYFVFAKTINIDEDDVKHIVSVDVNENNVIVKVLDKVYILGTVSS